MGIHPLHSIIIHYHSYSYRLRTKILNFLIPPTARAWLHAATPVLLLSILYLSCFSPSLYPSLPTLLLTIFLLLLGLSSKASSPSPSTSFSSNLTSLGTTDVALDAIPVDRSSP